MRPQSKAVIGPLINTLSYGGKIYGFHPVVGPADSRRVQHYELPPLKTIGRAA